jgi:predicted dehydrogenase
LAGDAESVFARVGTKARNIEVEDTAVALVQFKSGAYGVIEGTTSVYPGEQARIELHGTNGSVILADSGIKLWAIEDPPVLEDVDLCGNDASTSKDPGNFPKNSHVELIEDLIESIDSGRETLIPAREGRKAVDLILAIYESARTGKEVRL